MNKSNWPRLIWAVVLITVMGTGALFAGQLSAGRMAAAPSAGGLMGPVGGNAGNRAGAPAAGLVVQQAAPGGPIVSASVRNDLSAPLASIQPIAPAQGDQRETNEVQNFLPGRENAGPGAPLPNGLDPLLQNEQSGPDVPKPSVNFEGVNNVNGVLPPDTSIGYHQHNAIEEIYYLVSGRGRMTVNDQTFDVGPGDAVPCTLHDSHGLYNSGSGDILLIVNSCATRGKGVYDVNNWGDDLSKR